MHYLSLKDPVPLGANGVIEPGEYVTEDLSAAQLITHAGGGKMSPLELQKPFDETQDWNGKRILFVRIGGFGDIVLLTPVPREMKRRWPKCHITVACMKHYQQVLQGLDFIDAIVNDPVDLPVFNTFDAWVILENAIERNPRAKKLHMTDLFAEIAGFKGTVRDLSLLGRGKPAILDKKPAYVVSPNEAIWVMEQYARTPGIRRLCVQVGTSAMCRTYPAPRMSLVVDLLIKKGWEIFLMGQRGEVSGITETAQLRNLAAAGLTFRQSCAVLNNADCFLGSDSALLHVAGALDIPAVGLYGPFPSEIRTKYCDKTVAMDGVGKCAPCFHHTVPTRRNHFPDHCPSRTQGFCQVIDSIKPELIVRNIELIAKSFELK